MLIFAARPKSSHFGRHHNNPSKDSQASSDWGESRGVTSKIQRLTQVAQSSRMADRQPSRMPPSRPSQSRDGVGEERRGSSSARTGREHRDVLETISEPIIKPELEDTMQPTSHGSAVSHPPEPIMTRKSSISFPEELPRPDHSPEIQSPIGTSSESSFGRRSSATSLSQRARPSPSLKHAAKKQTSRDRCRTPPPPRPFRQHVGFDNVPSGEATKNNTLSLTLNRKHNAYTARRRSRSFMVGIDGHQNSDYAVQWLLEMLVDDGDEVICVHVVEKEYRWNDKQYRDDAERLFEGILKRNSRNRALSFVLEYAVGKLHATFQMLMQIYQPAMLIVGTKGRSLGGIQGLVNSRNSFSKYCLQYSPVPVVVVRPTEKRIKKKMKRANDSTRRTYASMLAANNGIHEADSETSSTYDMEIQNTPDEEAHQVAKVLGLPAAFDPTIKPLRESLLPRSRPSSPHPAAGGESGRRPLERSPGSAGGDTEEDEEEEEEEFDVIEGQDALNQQQKLAQLHKMEVGEAAALKRHVDDDDEESDETNDAKGTS